MKLYFPFPRHIREYYRDYWKCFECGQNGQYSGGLEIHHILGRAKNGDNLDSAFNSSLLCKKCHNSILHTPEVHNRLFNKSVDFFQKRWYQPTKNDWDFIKNNARKLGLLDNI